MENPKIEDGKIVKEEDCEDCEDLPKDNFKNLSSAEKNTIMQGKLFLHLKKLFPEKDSFTLNELDNPSVTINKYNILYKRNEIK